MISTWIASTWPTISSWVVWLLTIILLLIMLAIVRKALVIYLLRHRTIAYLELIPPAHRDKMPTATSQLFYSLHGLGMHQSWRERLLLQKPVVSLEIVATKQQGIRFIVTCDETRKEAVEQLITAYAPDVKIKKCDDYLEGYPAKQRVIELRQAAHFAYPLQAVDSLQAQDPIGFITTAMTKLEDGELIAYQLTLEAIRSKEADTINHKILGNHDILPMLSRTYNFSLFHSMSNHISKFLFGIGDSVTMVAHSGSQDYSHAKNKDIDYQQQVAKRLKPARTLSYFEQQTIESISIKLSQPLFAVDMRFLIAVKSKKRYETRRKNILAALHVYATPKHQKLVARSIKQRILQKYLLSSFKRRLPSLQRGDRNIFSADEVSSLYHFPHSINAKTDNVAMSLSKTLPAPISLKGAHKLDVVIGENIHHGVTTPIGLTVAERERHMYIIGGTGNGKTTMMLYSIVQDIHSGKGVAVIDPHGDLAETILRHIPEERIKDVIYFNPDDLEYPIGMNLLEMPKGLTGDDLLREKDLITESAISVLRKIFSEDDSGGHRIEYVLRNAIQTALTYDGATLFTIFRLLNDNKYRRDVVKTLEDEDLKNFWKNEIGKAGDFQRVKMSAGITAKIGRFLFSASAKKILEQEKSTIDFDDILDSGKILICNFSKGLLGEDTSALFGITVLAKIQVASLRRARLQQDQRQSYYLYVDEFQNFATMSFVQMLSEARKYKIFLTMAEQSTSQQEQQRLVDIILANVGTVVCFRSGSPADERLVLPLFKPFVEEGEIANLPAYSFYARIAAVNSQEPMSGLTLLVDNQVSLSNANNTKKFSRERYGLLKEDEKPKNNKPKTVPVSTKRQRGSNANDIRTTPII